MVRDRGLRVAPAGGAAVRAGEHGDLDFDRVGRAEVAVDRTAVERTFVHEEPEREVMPRHAAEERRQLLAGPEAAADPDDELLAHRVVPDEGDAAVRKLAPGRGLRHVVHERAEAQRLHPRELVGERLVEHGAQLRRERTEDRLQAGLQPELLAQHLERVVVHVEVVEVALLHAAQRRELRQHGRDQAEAVGEREAVQHTLGDHEPAELGPDPLRRRLRHAARVLAGQALGLGIGRERQARSRSVPAAAASADRRGTTARRARAGCPPRDRRVRREGRPPPCRRGAPPSRSR